MQETENGREAGIYRPDGGYDDGDADTARSASRRHAASPDEETRDGETGKAPENDDAQGTIYCHEAHPSQRETTS